MTGLLSCPSPSGPRVALGAAVEGRGVAFLLLVSPSRVLGWFGRPAARTTAHETSTNTSKRPGKKAADVLRACVRVYSRDMSDSFTSVG